MFKSTNLNIIVVLGGIIAILIGLIFIQSSRMSSKDTKIETMKQEVVQESAKTENRVFQKEHQVIGDNIEKKEVKHEVNLTIGSHSISFK